MANNDNDLNQDKNLEDPRFLRTITYRLCNTHGVRYPEGERCPLCESGGKQPEESYR